MSRLAYREEDRGGRLLIIDAASEVTPEAFAMVGEPLQGGLGLDGDEWVKALPYERTLAVEG
jgi:hypothetical protein